MAQAAGQPIELSQARLDLLKYDFAAKRLHELEPIYRQARADYEQALLDYRYAAAAVARVARDLHIPARGGPGTLSL